MKINGALTDEMAEGKALRSQHHHQQTTPSLDGLLSEGRFRDVASLWIG